MESEAKAVGYLSELLALKNGYTTDEAEQIKIAAYLHDIGKVLIDSKILDKPSSLTADEFEKVKLHTKIGAQILSGMRHDLGQIAQKVCLWHHEKYDGNGYWGIKAYQLPTYIRIVTVADVAVALLSKRCYKPAWTLNETLDYIGFQAETHFCPKIACDFISLVKGDERVSAFLSAQTGRL